MGYVNENRLKREIQGKKGRLKFKVVNEGGLNMGNC
jgi:hypothetical protein